MRFWLGASDFVSLYVQSSIPIQKPSHQHALAAPETWPKGLTNFTFSILLFPLPHLCLRELPGSARSADQRSLRMNDLKLLCVTEDIRHSSSYRASTEQAIFSSSMHPTLNDKPFLNRNKSKACNHCREKRTHLHPKT